MADKKQKRNNNNYDEDYNPKFRKQRKKVCVLCSLQVKRLENLTFPSLSLYLL